MRMSMRLLVGIGCLALLITSVIVATPKKADAIGSLSFDWSCFPSASATCSLQVTSSNHAKYQWAFGDGSFAGPSTSTSASHNYSFTGIEHNFTVYLSGYASLSSNSPDNVISCTVTALHESLGGDPGTHGSCNQ